MKPNEFKSPVQFLNSAFYEIYENEETGQKHIRMLGKYTELARAPSGFQMYTRVEYDNVDMRLSRFLLEMDDAIETDNYPIWYAKTCKEQRKTSDSYIDDKTVLNEVKSRFGETEIKCQPVKGLRRNNPVGIYCDRQSFSMQKKRETQRETQQQRVQRLFAKYLAADLSERTRSK